MIARAHAPPASIADRAARSRARTRCRARRSRSPPRPARAARGAEIGEADVARLSWRIEPGLVAALGHQRGQLRRDARMRVADQLASGAPPIDQASIVRASGTPLRSTMSPRAAPASRSGVAARAGSATIASIASRATITQHGRARTAASASSAAYARSAISAWRCRRSRRVPTRTGDEDGHRRPRASVRAPLSMSPRVESDEQLAIEHRHRLRPHVATATARDVRPLQSPSSRSPAWQRPRPQP